LESSLTTETHFFENEEGDIEVLGICSRPSPNSQDYSSSSFEPPVLFLDLPLEVGKSWQTETMLVGGEASSWTYSYEVIAQEGVVVPAGDFTVFVVRETKASDSGSIESLYYLDRELGPILYQEDFELVNTERLVGSKKESLGGAKALYR